MNVPFTAPIIEFFAGKRGGTIWRMNPAPDESVVSPFTGALTKATYIGSANVGEVYVIDITRDDGVKVRITNVILDNAARGAASKDEETRWSYVINGERLGRTGKAPTYVSAFGPTGEGLNPADFIMRADVKPPIPVLPQFKQEPAPAPLPPPPHGYSYAYQQQAAPSSPAPAPAPAPAPVQPVIIMAPAAPASEPNTVTVRPSEMPARNDGEILVLGLLIVAIMNAS